MKGKVITVNGVEMNFDCEDITLIEDDLTIETPNEIVTFNWNHVVMLMREKEIKN